MIKRLQLVLPILFLLMQVMPAAAQIRVNEVAHDGADFEGSTTWVELYNAGSMEMDVSELFLCNFPLYPRISNLNVLAGSTTIPAGGYLVVDWSGLGTADAEVGLYVSTTSNFGDASSMLDYMQYGTAGHTRETPAVTAGVWAAGEFVPASATGESLQYFDTGSPGAANWSSATPTPGEENMNVQTSNEEFDQVPGTFALKGNFPNPFNPTTQITYELNQAGFTTLTVYNLLGRKVTDLVSGVVQAGQYQVEWDGTDSEGQVVPSGAYLYRLTFENGESQSRLMTLLK